MTVVEWRARALYNKFWKELPSNPQWMRQIIQDNPDIFTLLVRGLQGDQESLIQAQQQIRAIAQDEANTRAQQQVAGGSFTIERIKDTLDYQ